MIDGRGERVKFVCEQIVLPDGRKVGRRSREDGWIVR